jgi:hypothetical protein
MLSHNSNGMASIIGTLIDKNTIRLYMGNARSNLPDTYALWQVIEYY